MKVTKIIAAAVLMTLIVASLSGCIILTHEFNHIDKTNVTTVEIYDLRDDYSHDARFYELMEPLYTLSPEQNAEFLDTLTSLRFIRGLLLIAANDPILHYGPGLTVKVNHSNGAFETVSCFGYAETYDPEADTLGAWDYGSCDEAAWELLMKSVMPEELYNSEPKEHYGTFSYKKALEDASASGTDIRTSEFVNGAGYDYSDYSGDPLSWYAIEDILLCAKKDCTVKYESAELYIDREEYFYCIEFTAKTEKERIYLNRNLATVLAVKTPIS